jgi:putative sporulation protein YtxC
VAVFRRYVAHALSDVIMGQWEKLLLNDIIRENYYYFNEEERKTIYQYASGYINQDSGSDLGATHYRAVRRNKILQKIMEFLRSNNDIVIDGFIRFRLKEYVGELHEAADRAVDDFLMEREYKEFVQLLKYFVEIQDPRVDVVHVLLKPNGVFKLFDGQYRVLNSEYLEGFMMDLVDSEINYEDMLISTLITVAPQEIVFHPGKGEAPRNTIETIKNVFSNRVKLCGGCELCNGNLDKN